MYKIINNKYDLLEKIGEGSFGTIYKGLNIRTKETIAIKVEPISNGTKLLKNESIIYQYISSNNNANIGLPSIKWFGKDDINYYMVINLLGESLQTILNRMGSFSLTLVLKIGIQVISLLKNIHAKGLVHRDIKPDNFLMGLGEQNKQIFIIDFGFCKSILNGSDHIEMRETKGFVGSLTYASVNAHYCKELSRRDDLESLGYMLIYFLFGKLDWQMCTDNQIILNMKENILNNSFIPEVLLSYFKYIRKLKFQQPPNYEYLIMIFQTTLKELLVKSI